MRFLKNIFETYLKRYTEKKSFSKIIIPSFIIHAVAALLALTLIFLLPRSLGVRRYGVYTYALAIAGILTRLNGFGINGMVTRETSALLSQNKIALWKGFCRWSFKALLRNSFILTISGILLIIVFTYGLHLVKETQYTKPVILAMGLAPLLVLMNYLNSLLKGRHKIVISLLPDNIIKPVIFLLLLGLAIIFIGKLTVIRVILLYFVAIAAGLLFAFIVFKRISHNDDKIEPQYDLSKWKSFFKSFAIIAIVGSISSKTDIIVLGHLKNAASVGIYGAADKVAGFLTVFISIMMQISSPAVARLNTLGEKEKLQKGITKNIRWIFACSVFFYLLMVTLSKWIMLYFGPGFADGRNALIILATGKLISIAFGPVGMISIMTGNERINVILMCVSFVLNVILNFILVPLYGFTGTAIAATLVLLFWNFAMFVIVKKKTGIRTWILG